MKILDAAHPFYRPLWRRIAIVALSFAWAAFELSNGETIWAMVFGAIGLYCGWALLVAYKPVIGDGEKNG
ncbi:hypothetical protein [Aquamicrobium defluvii]|uniref:DUF3329 domain-containing protein n=1 Tax=Aquamicrobium defluvii TaxID=69279 RepID=A0A011SVA9_9HYPH|nr:hypothetical protein [Aquamicrobium defluvii]EXL03204.1 hypothetical protein BG36_12815 [Aquamicrobium defluvii]EZQ13491.1 hypothetical protein CF98_27640 [Halopseudomonas bauzanensis]TDR33640.1 hypothetical protein DES43_12040 [Aquamicrobium defluvii]